MGNAALVVVIAALIMLYAILGYRRGFTGQLASFAGMVIGIVAAAMMPEEVRISLGDWLPYGNDRESHEFLAQFVPAAAIYFLFYLLMLQLTPFFMRAFGKRGKGLFNSLGGSLFGVLKTLMIVSIVLNILMGCGSMPSLVRGGSAQDGNLMELTLLLAPALLDTPDVNDLSLQIQLREARKISRCNFTDSEIVVTYIDITQNSTIIEC